MGLLVISERGSRLSADGRRLVVTRSGTRLHRVRIHEVDQVVLIGPIDASATALSLCLREGVDVVYLTGNGRYRGRLVGPDSPRNVLRLQQYRATADPEVCQKLTRSFLRGKITNQRALLLRAQRRIHCDEIAGTLPRLRDLKRRLSEIDELDSLRGMEGVAAAIYFGTFGRLIRNAEFTFEHRNRRPPTDPVNACLSFGYTMLGVEAESRAQRVGLDPQLGFLHQPSPGRPSLVLDVIEEFRPIIDRLILRLINRHQLTPRDFGPPHHGDVDPCLNEDIDSPPNGDPYEEHDEQGALEPLHGQSQIIAEKSNRPDPPKAPVYLLDTGRRVFLAAFFREMRTVRYHASIDQRLELRTILEHQFRAVARIISGDQEEYEPFTIES